MVRDARPLQFADAQQQDHPAVPPAPPSPAPLPTVGGVYLLGEDPPSQWATAAEELADWVQRHLVNRTDVYGAYLPLSRRESGRSNNYTAPAKDVHRLDGALSEETILRHFWGADHGDLIGLHAIGQDNLCRWFVVDIDKHGDEDSTTLEINLAAAIGWYDKLKTMGFHPLLLDSNGAGGFHLLQVFSEPVPSDRVFNFGHNLVLDYASRGLRQPPEVFPKQPNVNPSRRYGSWWRLMGMHHTRRHWTKVWDGTKWLEGRPAIDAILAVVGDPPGLIPAELNVATETAAAATTRQVRVSQPGRTPHDSEHWLEVLEGSGAGGRHSAILQLAGYLLGKRVDPLVVEELCVIWNEARNQPPREDEHVRQTVRDLAERGRATAIQRQRAGIHGIISIPSRPEANSNRGEHDE